MLHSVQAVYNTATFHLQTLTSRRKDEVLKIEFCSKDLINSMFRMRFQDRDLPVQALHFPVGKHRPPFPNKRTTPPRLS
ncbi:uncharacterized protein LOC119768853 isoform X2 [Culex quinquefasciatus]|uniref:uncharacterized protein LOC119768853 isoform X2 n=1 Tax=Culex quinquefasciatus TaxID=7176 RepID=UPI0018E34914|nr:uncharacterized protein LOC119768853 isoform X2 [Culex quinquefasciatus]